MATIRDPQERRLRALMMLEMRLKKAASLDEIAREFNVAVKTVQKNLTWARKAGLIADAEDKILQELVPAAHEALKEALKDASPAERGRLAIEIFKGTIAGFKKTPSNTVSTTGGDDLDTYLAALRADNSTPNAIDGEILEGGPQRALPAAPETRPEEGAVLSNLLPAPLQLDGESNPPEVGERECEGAAVDAAGE